MPTRTLTIKYKKNTGLILSAMEMDALFLYGVNMYSKDGTNLSNEAKRTYLLASQEEIEKYFNIRFKPQLITETETFHRDDYMDAFPIIKTTYPVNTPLTMVGLLGKIEQLVYPSQWLYAAKNNQGFFQKRISTIPNGSATAQANGDVILTGITAQVGLQRFRQIPDYWTVQYTTGYDRKNLPMDVLNLVGKMASINVMAILGDLAFGAGVSSMSLGIDGLSESISTTKSPQGGIFAGRIKQYQEDIKNTMDRLRNQYKGINFNVL